MNCDNEEWARAFDRDSQEAPPTENDACEMHSEDGTHERLSWADECAYCGTELAP